MKITSASSAFAASLLLLGAWMAPAFAHSGGGHGGGGGGGHSFGGGGHSFGGGGHYSGAAHAGAAHFAARGYGGANYAAAARGPVAHYSGAAGFGASGRAAVASAGFAGRAAIGGARFAHPGAWGGGYWGGRYWPGAYYGAGFAWFLPVLGFGYATYWWNDVPYYYYNDAYYTWSPSADGYVATEPPPAAPANDQSDAAAPTYAGPEQQPAMPVQPGQLAGPDNIFAYPAQGQSAAQQASDRQECTQWAASQAGSANGSPDYRRALIACFEGRGYSAQ
jgi:hypothetical protein